MLTLIMLIMLEIKPIMKNKIIKDVNVLNVNHILELYTLMDHHQLSQGLVLIPVCWNFKN